MPWVAVKNANIFSQNKMFQDVASLLCGLIYVVDTGNTLITIAIDCEGRLTLPSLVDFHTGNIKQKLQSPWSLLIVTFRDADSRSATGRRGGHHCFGS